MKVCSVCRRCYDDSALSCSEDNHDILSDARAGNCEIIPNYRLEVLHESAPNGDTYRAVNTILNKPYLIRIVAPAAFDETAKKQFLAEAQALASIIHPNVARVFESGTLSDGSLYVVTEYFTAQTLRECFENVGKPSEVTALTIVRQAAEGLEALHAAGVLHRAVKPENIILTADAENTFLIKLQNMDFGALRQRQVNAAGDLFLADLRYFSPEQCAAEESDAQTDVYALGIVLYEALAGKVPFDAAYADALVIKQIKEQPPEIKINSFDIRMLLTHTLSDALQKTTRARLKTANAMARRLRHIEQLATHSSTPPPAMAYPAAMNKTAVAFTPPAKSEKTAEIETPFKSVPVVETASIAETAYAPEPPAIIEEAVSFETASAFESLPTIAATPALVEDSPSSEPEALIEDAPPTEPSMFVGELPATAPSINVEEAPATLPAMNIEEISVAAETAKVVPDLPLVETPAVAETQPAVEIPSMETEPAIDARAFAEELPATETKAVIEGLPEFETQAAAGEAPMVETPPLAVETPPLAEEIPAAETRAIVAEIPFAQTAAVFETLPSIETAAVAEEFVESEAAAEETVENEADVEQVFLTESEVLPENPVFVEKEAAAEDSSLAVSESILENPLVAEREMNLENAPAAEIEPLSQTADAAQTQIVAAETAQVFEEQTEPPEHAVVDYTTTKLPPIEKIISAPDFKVTEIETIFSLKRGDLEIHKTSEPVLIEWEQPDDVPTITAALNISKKNSADVQFVPNADVIDEKFEEKNVAANDDADADAETDDVEYVSEAHKTRRDYASVSSVFASYEESAGSRSWNLVPGKRALLTGAAICGLLVIAVGGVFLNRQMQTADTQTTAKSSPANPKTLPKPAEPQQNAETVAPAKPETLNTTPTAAAEPDLPNYTPRETTDVKPVATVSQTVGKKRSAVKTAENSKNAAESKPERAEVFDKKGNVKPAPDKKAAVKNQASTQTKNDVFTRPRVVKNPKF